MIERFGKLPDDVDQLKALALAELMVSVGFKPYAMEWWHFELRDAPFDSEFDFEVLPR
jgi:D-alanyl-D-alanine dipeptidase